MDRRYEAVERVIVDAETALRTAYRKANQAVEATQAAINETMESVDRRGGKIYADAGAEYGRWGALGLRIDRLAEAVRALHQYTTDDNGPQEVASDDD